MNNYFIFTKFEDGIHMDYISKDILNKRLDEGYYSNYRILNKIPKHTTKFWKNRDVLIINGDIIILEKVLSLKKLMVNQS